MTIRTKFFLVTFIVFISLFLIAALSIWVVTETQELNRTIDTGVELLSEAKIVHGLMKDLIFDLFSPQMYVVLRGLTYSPRPTMTLREWSTSANQFKKTYYEFMALPKLRDLLRDDELRDTFEIAGVMSQKAFDKIDELNTVLSRLRDDGLLGRTDLYFQIQSGEDKSLMVLFDQVKETSFYLTNNFESYLNHFVTSIKRQNEEIQRNVLILYWSLAFGIGTFALVLSLLFSTKIVVRVQSVESAIRHVSLGDFSTRLDIRSQDEFQHLSDNFNKFVMDLKNNVNSLLKLMNDVADTVSGQADFSEVLNIVVNATVQDIQVDGAAIFLWNEGTQVLQPAAIRGYFPPPYEVPLAVSGSRVRLEDHFRKTSIKPGNGVLGHFPLNEKAVFIKDSSLDDRLIWNRRPGPQYMKSFIAVPLKIQDRLLGAIAVCSIHQEKGLTDLEFIQISSFADYAAVTMDNYFKYRELLEKREAEYQALQSQIQPHFLYNTLNGLIGLNRMNNRDGVEKTILALRNMLRYILEHGDRTSIEEELLFINRYLELQKIRFGERLDFSISFDDTVAQCEIPKLLLQPLVENAVIHGLEPLERFGKLNISVSMNGEVLHIDIEDNGIGFDTERRKMESVGLKNVKERLSMFSPASIFLLSSNPGEGTVVRLRIPLTNTKRNRL